MRFSTAFMSNSSVAPWYHVALRFAARKEHGAAGVMMVAADLVFVLVRLSERCPTEFAASSDQCAFQHTSLF